MCRGDNKPAWESIALNVGLLQNRIRQTAGQSKGTYHATVIFIIRCGRRIIAVLISIRRRMHAGSVMNQRPSLLASEPYWD